MTNTQLRRESDKLRSRATDPKENLTFLARYELLEEADRLDNRIVENDRRVKQLKLAIDKNQDSGL
jgi:hypothetical protein